MTKYAGGLLLGLLILSGCMTKATVDVTNAPFKATTDLTNGTSQASKDLLNPLTEFTSSSTPGASAGDQLIRARQKTEVFASYSYEHLRGDIARGSGEHLVSLATLAGVPPDRQKEFQGQMRDAYLTMFTEPVSFRDSTIRVVNAAWTEGFGRRETAGTEHRSSLIPNVELRAKMAPRSSALMSRE